MDARCYVLGGGRARYSATTVQQRTKCYGTSTATTERPLQQLQNHYNNATTTTTTERPLQQHHWTMRARVRMLQCVLQCVLWLCAPVCGLEVPEEHTLKQPHCNIYTATTTLQHAHCNNYTATCTLACLCCSKCFGNCACALTNTGGGGERGVHEDIHWNITHCNTLQRTEHCTTLHSLQHTKTH